jgi:CubicO group peptidase (beta-lactamase class C family)
MPDDALRRRIDAIFSEFHAGRTTPELAYGVARNGALVHVGGLGRRPPGAASVFRIASMTKSFTAAAALLLRDEGTLSLDEPVVNYVPEVAGFVVAAADAPPLTLRMLLTMSAGLSTDDPWADRQESITPMEFSQLLQGGVLFSSVPGTVFEYSNLGYAIVGRAITNVAGADHRSVIRTRLIDPLGLDSTRFDADEIDPAILVPGHRADGDGWEPLPFDRSGEFSAIGGLYSSIADLARWIDGFSDAFVGTNRHPHPLSTASRREMQQIHRFSTAAVADPVPGVVAAPGAAALRSAGYGFGLNVAEDSRWGRIVSHSGGYPGFGSHMRWHLGTGYAVIALGNAMYAPVRRPATAALDVLLHDASPRAAVVTAWPQTVAMQRAVQRLLLEWDDAVADVLFADNMDLDVPRERRRRTIHGVLSSIGTLDPEPRDVRCEASASQMRWTVVGSQGTAAVEIALDPLAEPRLMTLTVTPSMPSQAD